MKKASRVDGRVGKFCLLRWLQDDEQVSVMLTSAIRAGQKSYVGAIGEFKWQGKYYDAEILKLSDNRQELSKLCDRLCKQETTREEVLAESESSVHTTTPEKKAPKKKKTYQKDACSTPNLKKAKIETAKKRAKFLFSFPGYTEPDSDSEQDSEPDSGGGEMERLRQRVFSLEKELKQKKSTSSANLVRNSKVHSFNVGTVQVGPRVMHLEPGDTKEMGENKEENCITEVKGCHGITGQMGDTRSSMDGSPEEHLGSTPGRRDLFGKIGKRSAATTMSPNTEDESYDDIESNNNMAYDSYPFENDYSAATNTSHTISRKDEIVTSKAKPSESGSGAHTPKSSRKIPPKMTPPKQIELVNDYGVYCTQMQLDEAVASAKTPTKLVRNLISIFYTPEQLAVCTAYGKRGQHQALDQRILSSCIHYVQHHYGAVAKTVLIDAVNDKCANYRRKKK